MALFLERSIDLLLFAENHSYFYKHILQLLITDKKDHYSRLCQGKNGLFSYKQIGYPEPRSTVFLVIKTRKVPHLEVASPLKCYFTLLR